MALRKRLDVKVFRKRAVNILKKRIDFYLCFFFFFFFFFPFFFFFFSFFFFRFEGKIVKLKIIKFFCLFIKTAVAANGLDLPVMRKFLGQKWQNHNFGDKTFFTRF